MSSTQIRLRPAIEQMSAKRRQTLALGAGVLALPSTAIAQQPQKLWRIGFLGVASAAGYVKEVAAIRAGLRDFGYEEGRNLQIELRWAEGSPDVLTRMAAELVALKPDLILTHGIPGARAATRATGSIPIVMADGGDPVAAGLVASFARPGGNLTGSSGFHGELTAKWLELLKSAVPKITRVAVLTNAANPNLKLYIAHAQQAARLLKLELHEFSAGNSEELAAAFAAMARRRVDALAVLVDPVLNGHATLIGALSLKARLPSIGLRSLAEAGGLLAYGALRLEVYRRAAYFADRIFKGAKPADLPVEQPTKFELVLNLKTAKALRLKIPYSLTLRATEVIE